MPEVAELLASWVDPNPTESSTETENVGQSSDGSNPVPQGGSSDSTNTDSATSTHDCNVERATTSGSRKRPGTSIMQQLLDLHKEEAATAEKAAKKSRKLMEKG
ncbi:hypothetical protein HPB52_006901 [Rhipicephalus sanguineus]|uniref:Uncharacterized protein n=1 Tax=Rhipicephalus sanguineus TaxID=34632 RepID=A0A9D4PHU1_RHISA|nr:hypothetical protein HPB52_006901 [Rhipicephalus sanguineus]